MERAFKTLAEAEGKQLLIKAHAEHQKREIATKIERSLQDQVIHNQLELLAMPPKELEKERAKWAQEVGLIMAQTGQRHIDVAKVYYSSECQQDLVNTLIALGELDEYDKKAEDAEKAGNAEQACAEGADKAEADAEKVRQTQKLIAMHDVFCEGEKDADAEADNPGQAADEKAEAEILELIENMENTWIWKKLQRSLCENTSLKSARRSWAVHASCSATQSFAMSSWLHVNTHVVHGSNSCCRLALMSASTRERWFVACHKNQKRQKSHKMERYLLYFET